MKLNWYECIEKGKEKMSLCFDPNEHFAVYVAMLYFILEEYGFEDVNMKIATFGPGCKMISHLKNLNKDDSIRNSNLESNLKIIDDISKYKRDY